MGCEQGDVTVLERLQAALHLLSQSAATNSPSAVYSITTEWHFCCNASCTAAFSLAAHLTAQLESSSDSVLLTACCTAIKYTTQTLVHPDV